METDLQIEDPSSRGFATLSPQLHDRIGRLEKAHRFGQIIPRAGRTGRLTRRAVAEVDDSRAEGAVSTSSITS